MWKQFFLSFTKIFGAVATMGDVAQSVANTALNLATIGEVKSKTLLEESLNEQEKQRMELAKVVPIEQAKAA